jgi:hypothetical protein
MFVCLSRRLHGFFLVPALISFSFLYNNVPEMS